MQPGGAVARLHGLMVGRGKDLLSGEACASKENVTSGTNRVKHLDGTNISGVKRGDRNE